MIELYGKKARLPDVRHRLAADCPYQEAAVYERCDVYYPQLLARSAKIMTLFSISPNLAPPGVCLPLMADALDLTTRHLSPAAVVELGSADALDEHRDFLGRETWGLALGGDQLGPRTPRGGVGAHDLMHHAE